MTEMNKYPQVRPKVSGVYRVVAITPLRLVATTARYDAQTKKFRTAEGLTDGAVLRWEDGPIEAKTGSNPAN